MLRSTSSSSLLRSAQKEGSRCLLFIGTMSFTASTQQCRYFSNGPKGKRQPFEPDPERWNRKFEKRKEDRKRVEDEEQRAFSGKTKRQAFVLDMEKEEAEDGTHEPPAMTLESLDAGFESVSGSDRPFLPPPGKVDLAALAEMRAEQIRSDESGALEMLELARERRRELLRRDGAWSGNLGALIAADSLKSELNQRERETLFGTESTLLPPSEMSTSQLTPSDGGRGQQQSGGSAVDLHRGGELASTTARKDHVQRHHGRRASSPQTHRGREEQSLAERSLNAKMVQLIAKPKTERQMQWKEWQRGQREKGQAIRLKWKGRKLEAYKRTQLEVKANRVHEPKYYGPGEYV